jgi:hypothetical protein
LTIPSIAFIASAQNATGGKWLEEIWQQEDQWEGQLADQQAMVVTKVPIMEDGAKYNYNIARRLALEISI